MKKTIRVQASGIRIGRRRKAGSFMLRRAVSTLLAAVAIVGGTATVSSAANGNCDNGEFCVYRNTDYSGGVWDFPGSNAFGLQYNVSAGYFFNTPTPVNNNVSSISNLSVYQKTAYAEANFSGPAVFIRAVGTGCLSGICPAYHSLGWADNQLSSHV
ncbi:peptidase inhibitor family I36 protein [Streptomyces sp. NPDC056069]|uniref:peptidase inhibitor family I36 protein n=1 Tax=Streptomyces sp. NPDC056069 TaxID=3345702 RepID=UPI0035DAED91